VSDKTMAEVTAMSFERRYSDGSGCEYGVRLIRDRSAVELESIESVVFPIEQLSWLIACLQRIRVELEADHV